MTLLTAEDRCEISETLSLSGHIFEGGQLDQLGGRGQEGTSNGNQ